MLELPEHNNKILNLILENLFAADMSPERDFDRTIGFLRSYFDAGQNLNFNADAGVEMLKILNNAVYRYIFSEKIDFSELISSISGARERIAPGYAAKNNAHSFFEFIDCYRIELKKTVKSAIKKKMEFDSKNCSKLVEMVLEKINLFYSELFLHVSKNKKTFVSDTLKKHHNLIHENYEKFKTDILNFFSTDSYYEIKYGFDSTDHNYRIDTVENSISYLKLKPSDAVNIALTIMPFSSKILNYNQKKLLALNLLFDYPKISMPPSNYLFIFEINEIESEEALPEAESYFLKAIFENLQTSNLNVVFQFENKIQNLFMPLIGHLNLILNKNENINILVQSLLKEIEKIFDCDFAAMSFIENMTGTFSFLCSSELRADDINTLKTIIDGDEHVMSSLIQECMLSQKVIISKNIDIDIKLTENSDKMTSIKSVMVVPVYNLQKNIGIIMLFSRNTENFEFEHKLAFEKAREYIANAINNLISYNCLKNDMSNLKLMQSQIISTEKLKLLGEVATGIAHNFNNLLAIILGRVGLLQRNIKDIKQLASLKIIEDAIKDGERMIKKIQAFMTKRSDSSNYSPVDLAMVLRNVIEYAVVRAKVEEYLKGITIIIKHELDNVSETYANAEELHEVFINLTFNAIEAMPTGGELKIKLEQSGDGKFLIVSIADNGIGMSRETQQKLFTPFFTTKGQLGTGLGLSYSYGTISRHKGTISIESALGKGSEFVIKLPILKKTLNITDYAAVNEPAFKKSRILIVDDDEQVRSALNDIMLVLGHDVISVSGGPEAIEILTNDTDFDFVFTDLKMPKVSGFEVAQFVKKKSPATFVGIITAYGSQFDEREFKDVKVDAIIGKPFNIRMIENIMSDAVKYKNKRTK